MLLGGGRGPVRAMMRGQPQLSQIPVAGSVMKHVGHTGAGRSGSAARRVVVRGAVVRAFGAARRVPVRDAEDRLRVVLATVVLERLADRAREPVDAEEVLGAAVVVLGDRG